MYWFPAKILDRRNKYAEHPIARQLQAIEILVNKKNYLKKCEYAKNTAKQKKHIKEDIYFLKVEKTYNRMRINYGKSTSLGTIITFYLWKRKRVCFLNYHEKQNNMLQHCPIDQAHQTSLLSIPLAIEVCAESHSPCSQHQALKLLQQVLHSKIRICRTDCHIKLPMFYKAMISIYTIVC